ncbi:hypothetical protein [Microcoleus sp. Pol12B5]|uniref:hypothetical protein n=1 Tax=unclassified Microcoleus TaxID=2642155 RepID=UPI002FD2FD33
MSANRIINTGGGAYNESIHGNNINIQGNHINISQDLSQAATQIEELLTKLQTQGYTPEKAQEEVTNKLANQANNDPITRSKLAKIAHYLGEAAANGLIGEATIEIFKNVAKLAGIPLF